MCHASSVDVTNHKITIEIILVQISVLTFLTFQLNFPPLLSVAMVLLVPLSVLLPAELLTSPPRHLHTTSGLV